MSDPFKVFEAITLGVILADVVRHPEAVTYMAWQVQMFAEGRCTRCGYKLDHPYVKHESPWWGHYSEAEHGSARNHDNRPDLLSGV